MVLYRLIPFIAFFTLPQFISGQSNYNIINAWDFEDNTLGTYGYTEVHQDFNVYNVYPHDKEYITTDVINGSTTKVLKALHDPGVYYDGLQLNAYFDESETAYDEVYMTYNIKFGKEWNSTSGGKMPGIRGFPQINTPPADEEGFYYAPIFHPGNKLTAYHYDRTRDNGAENPWAIGSTFGDIYFSNGTWYNVTQRVVKNTFTEGIPNADGINEIWVNGKLIYQETNLKTLALESKGIDGFFLGNYYGGGTPDYLPLHQCDVYLDNVVIWLPTNDPTYGTRGLHNSSEILLTPAMITDRTLYYDQLITSQGQLKNSEYGNMYSPCIDEAYLIDAGENNRVTLTLNDYAIGSEDFIFLYDGNTTDAPLINVIKGTTAGSNIIINSTGRYLFIRFSTNTLDEGIGWNGIVEFSALELPVAPSALEVNEFTEKSISISWKDNSNNEEAFVITRNLVSDPDDIVELYVNANDTSFIDTELESGTTYNYSVKAVNTVGSSPFSNKKVAATLSVAETMRVRSGLIAYYNFGYNPDFVVYDVSGVGDPVNLYIPQPSSVLWEKNEELCILGATELKSFTYAKKIIDSFKATNEITFECWIKPLEPDCDEQARIFSLGNNDTDLGVAIDQNYIINNNNKSLTYSARLNTASTNQSGYPELTQNPSTIIFVNMYHIAYLRNAEGIETIYINGVKSAEGFRPSDFSTWKENYFLRLGNECDMNHFWKGSFYIVALYNKALTQEQISQNYNAGPRDNLVSQGMKYGIIFFPNPVSDLATIKIIPQHNSVDVVALTVLRILDTYGKVLYEENIFNPFNSYTKSFDFHDLKQGLYIIQVISGDEKHALKFIKR